MSDRSFVLAMYHNGLVEWDDSFAFEWVLTSIELLARGIISEAQHLAVGRDVRQAQRRYEQLRLEGVTPLGAMQSMVNDLLPNPAGTGPSAAGRQPGSAATQP